MSSYVWQPIYEAAMFETRVSAMEIRIAQAENALLDRLEDDIHGRCVLDSTERQAIENARKFLASLRLVYET